MIKKEEVNVAWALWNLLQELDKRLWERYGELFLDRHMEEEWNAHWESQGWGSSPESGDSDGGGHAGSTEE